MLHQEDVWTEHGSFLGVGKVEWDVTRAVYSSLLRDEEIVFILGKPFMLSCLLSIQHKHCPFLKSLHCRREVWNFGASFFLDGSGLYSANEKHLWKIEGRREVIFLRRQLGANILADDRTKVCSDFWASFCKSPALVVQAVGSAVASLRSQHILLL